MTPLNITGDLVQVVAQMIAEGRFSYQEVTVSRNILSNVPWIITVVGHHGSWRRDLVVEELGFVGTTLRASFAVLVSVELDGDDLGVGFIEGRKVAYRTTLEALCVQTDSEDKLRYGP